MDLTPLIRPKHKPLGLNSTFVFKKQQSATNRKHGRKFDHNNLHPVFDLALSAMLLSA
jgi:hypothetical protein